MFDLFLNTAKLITSEDTRKTASAIIDIIRRSPEWQKDICLLEASIKKNYMEQAILLSDLTVTKMENINFDEEAVTAFKVIYLELIRNAFEHGCESDKDAVRIIIEITETYVGLSIINPKRRKFDVKTIIEKNKSMLVDNTALLRGRGLLFVMQLAYALEMIENGVGIKAVIYSERVEFTTFTIEGVRIINMISGIYNPSFTQRLADKVAEQPHLDVILNFEDLGLVTDVTREIIKINVKANGKQRVIAIIVRKHEIMLPSNMVATSFFEALNKIGRAESYKYLPVEYKNFDRRVT